LTLPIPNLDDRSFEDLMAEAISLIPRYNREWTDFNASDPGVTLLELLAWISESTLYSINEIPDESYWKFIDLVGLGRQEKTDFVKELAIGDILVVGGEISMIASIESSTALTLIRSFDRDIERPEKASSLKPVACPDQVMIDGKSVSGIRGDYLSILQPGHILGAGGIELGVIQSVTGSDSLTTAFPFSSKLKGSGTIAVLVTSECQGTVRARGRHVMGEDTNFRELLPGDVIVLAGRIRVVNQIRSELLLTVSEHFDEDIHDAVAFYSVRPAELTGTLISDGTGIAGNPADEDLESATLRAVQYVSGRYRAVTTSDYEILIRAALKDRLGDMDYRVVCLSNRNFEWGGIGNERPGHITAILIVKSGNSYPEKSELIEGVKAFMDQRRILTTRIHAVFPQFRKISVAATLLGLKGADKERIQQDAAQKLGDFIDPIKGGPDSSGWPLGRNLYRSEIYQILEGVPGVDHVINVQIDGSDTLRFVKLAEYELIDLDYFLAIKEV